MILTLYKNQLNQYFQNLGGGNQVIIIILVSNNNFDYLLDKAL